MIPLAGPGIRAGSILVFIPCVGAFLTPDLLGGGKTVMIGNLLLKIDPVLASEQPDAMLVLGDTNSCLAVIAAKRHKIPVFHMEAGNRCFDERVPEEINRLVTDQLADLLFTPSEDGDQNLRREGISEEKIFFVGNVMIDSLVRLLPEAQTAWTEKSRSNGLPEHYAHPDFQIVLPLEGKTLHALAAKLVDRVKKGERFAPGARVSGITARYAVWLIDAIESENHNFFVDREHSGKVTLTIS